MCSFESLGFSGLFLGSFEQSPAGTAGLHGCGAHLPRVIGDQAADGGYRGPRQSCTFAIWLKQDMDLLFVAQIGMSRAQTLDLGTISTGQCLVLTFFFGFLEEGFRASMRPKPLLRLAFQRNSVRLEILLKACKVDSKPNISQ